MFQPLLKDHQWGKGVLACYSAKSPAAGILKRGTIELCPETKLLAWFDFYRAQDRTAALTCRHIGISPDTFYGRRCRYKPGSLKPREDRSDRPYPRRQPTWTREQGDRVPYFPGAIPVMREGQTGGAVAARVLARIVSMVGRILTSLCQVEVLKESSVFRIERWRESRSLHWALRKPSD